MGLTNLQREYLTYRGELDNIANAKQRFAQLPARIAEAEQERQEARANLRRIQATLSKPWETYAGKGSLWRRDSTPQHQKARECYYYSKQMVAAQERENDYRNELRDQEQTLTALRHKEERVQIALALVTDQLRAIDAIPKEQWPTSAWGARCLQELYGLEEARERIQGYFAMVADELGSLRLT